VVPQLGALQYVAGKVQIKIHGINTGSLLSYALWSCSEPWCGGNTIFWKSKWRVAQKRKSNIVLKYLCMPLHTWA